MPRNPVIHDILRHAGLAIAAFVVMGLLARKYLDQYPYGILGFLLLTSFVLGLIHTFSLPRYPWALNNPVKAAGFTLLLTGIGIIVLQVLLRHSGFAEDLVIIPVFGMSVFFVEKALQQWNRMPAYMPPSGTLENYAEVTGLRVFEQSGTFIQFRLNDKSGNKPDLPYAMGWSVARAHAFNATLRQLFSAFILYNNFNENGPKQVMISDTDPLSGRTELYHWSFYIKTWLGLRRRYLVPGMTLNAQHVPLKFSWLRKNGTIRLIRKTTIYAIRFKQI